MTGGLSGFYVVSKLRRGVAQLVVRIASGKSQGNLPMQAMAAIVKFRAAERGRTAGM